jgi:4'-phosphopantetheinyl transferase EntD
MNGMKRKGNQKESNYKANSPHTKSSINFSLSALIILWIRTANWAVFYSLEQSWKVDACVYVQDGIEGCTQKN